MARIISVGKNNLIRSFLRKFNSLDLFNKLLIVTLVLLIIATSFIIRNYQLFNTYGETEAQRLRTIRQLQKSQQNLRDAFARSPAVSGSPAQTTNTAQPNSAREFNLIDFIYKILVRLTQFLN